MDQKMKDLIANANKILDDYHLYKDQSQYYKGRYYGALEMWKLVRTIFNLHPYDECEELQKKED